jgi:flagellar hook-associated protein 2
MSTLSSAGVGSGLDVESIVNALVAIERRPINQLATQASGLQTRLSAFGKLQSALSALRDAARTLTTADAWGAVKGTSADPASVAVSTGSGAVAGSYSVSVSQLAAAQTVVGTARPATDTMGSDGTLSIQLGSWAAGGVSPFTADTERAAVGVDIAATDTLAEVRDKINAAGAGVTASIVNDASGARLVVRSSETGTGQGFQIAASAGLEALGYDGAVGAGMVQTRAAANAMATINGIAIESASNTLGNVLDGLTLTLNKVTTGSTEITVEQDTPTIQASVQTFVDAYNAMIKLVAEQTRYDAATKTAAPLQGDRTSINMQYALRGVASGNSVGSTVFSRLAQVGLDPQSDGTLKVNTSKLTGALGQAAEVRKLFAFTDEDDATADGFAQQIRQMADRLLGTDGALSSRQTGLQAEIARNKARQSELEERVARTEARLRARYAALDTQMANLSALSGYVSQQVTSWNKNSGN